MQDLIAVGNHPPQLLKSDALLYSDCRAVEEAQALSDVLGMQVLATSLLPKLKLLPIPSSNSETSSFKLLIGAADYLTYVLSGCPNDTFTDATTVSTTGLSVAPCHRSYDKELLRRAGLDSFFNHLPVILDKPAVVGNLSLEIAKCIGYEQLTGTNIVHAGGDAFSATVGVGCSHTEAGAYLYAGTTGWLATTIPHRKWSLVQSDSLFRLGHAADRHSSIIAASVVSVGSALQHACDVFLNCHVSHLDVLAQNSKIGARGAVYVPYINGRRCPSPKDVTSGGLFGVTISTSQADIARAVVEGVTFSFVEASNEMPATVNLMQLRAVGGVCQCHTFLHGVSALIGHVELSHPEAGLVGAGTIAASALLKTYQPRTSNYFTSSSPVSPEDKWAWERSLKQWRRVARVHEGLWDES